jgi:hypothetical protein
MEGERRKRRLWTWLVALAVLGGLAAYNYWPTEPEKIIISRETTYILGPLNADGTPNYVKYLDDKCAEGVTAANNAAPLLLRAFGPDLLSPRIRAETLRRLDLPADIFDGDKHFVGWRDRARPAKADANAAGDANAASSSAPAETDEDESENEPNLNEVFDMLLAGQVHPDLEAWLASNAGPLELIRRATARDRIYMPLVSASTPPRLLDVVIPTLQGLRQTAVALAARAILKMMHNDPAGAWDDVLALHRLARLMGKDSPTLVQCLVAVGIEELAGRAGIVLATRWLVGAAQARDVLGKLNALAPATDLARTYDQCERLLGLDVAIGISRGNDIAELFSVGGKPATGSKVRLHTNQVLRELNSWYDRMAKPMRLSRSQGRTEGLKAFEDEIKAFAAKRGGRATPLRVGLLKLGGRLTRQALTDVISDCLVSIMIPSFAGAYDYEDQAGMTFEIETLAVALACYRAEQGRWPAELKELCPSPLKEIPPDRFSTIPLIYRPAEKGYLLYSVGRNLRDDGGHCEPRGSGKSSAERADDIAAEVKPVEAASAPAASKPAASHTHSN